MKSVAAIDTRSGANAVVAHVGAARDSGRAFLLLFGLLLSIVARRYEDGLQVMHVCPFEDSATS